MRYAIGTDTANARRSAIHLSVHGDDPRILRGQVPNNRKHRRILVNELLGTRLAAGWGYRITPAEIIHVSEELIQLTPDCAWRCRARGFRARRAAVRGRATRDPEG